MWIREAVRCWKSLKPVIIYFKQYMQQIFQSSNGQLQINCVYINAYLCWLIDMVVFHTDVDIQEHLTSHKVSTFVTVSVKQSEYLHIFD